MANGLVNGYKTIKKIQTNQVVFAPNFKPCRENIDWGRISPKITINPVEIVPAKMPAVREPKNTAKAELTATLPKRSVHNNKFPFFLNG